MWCPTKRQRGFTLIELMITVAVIGILAGIALPAYQRYVTESRRAEAMAGLMAMQALQERWRLNNPSYGTATNLATVGSLPVSAYYDFTVSANAATTYTLQATAKSTQLSADSGCSPLTINEAGTKGAPSTNCWKK